MTWLAYFYRLLICPGVIPMVLMINRSGLTKLALLISPPVGIFAGLAVWFGVVLLPYFMVKSVSPHWATNSPVCAVD